MAPLLVVAILCSLTSILVIKSSYAHNGYIFSGDRRSSSLVGSVEREESSPRVIYSITFSKNSVAPLGNLKVVLDKLLRFHIQGSAFFFFSGDTSVEGRLVDWMFFHLSWLYHPHPWRFPGPKWIRSDPRVAPAGDQGPPGAPSH